MVRVRSRITGNERTITKASYELRKKRYELLDSTPQISSATTQPQKKSDAGLVDNNAEVIQDQQPVKERKKPGPKPKSAQSELESEPKPELNEA